MRERGNDDSMADKDDDGSGAVDSIVTVSRITELIVEDDDISNRD